MLVVYHPSHKHYTSHLIRHHVLIKKGTAKFRNTSIDIIPFRIIHICYPFIFWVEMCLFCVLVPSSSVPARLKGV